MRPSTMDGRTWKDIRKTVKRVPLCFQKFWLGPRDETNDVIRQLRNAQNGIVYNFHSAPAPKYATESRRQLQYSKPSTPISTWQVLNYP